MIVVKFKQDIKAAQKHAPHLAQKGTLALVATIAMTPRLKAVAWFRCANWLMRHNIAILPVLIQSHILRTSGADIHPGASIDGGFVLVHSVGVVIGEEVKAGENLSIHQCASIGSNGRNCRQPTLGNNIVIGAGACVLGEIKIGSNTIIGANAVVTSDVGEGDVVGGIPAKSL